MVLNRTQAISLARALRELRESTWPGRVLTQNQLATAFSSEGRVAPATLSSWESTTSPKTLPEARISTYARFFCTERSLEGEPHLIPKDQLMPAELDRYRELESELLKLFHPEEEKVTHSFRFDAGPVTVICPDLPPEKRGPLTDPQDRNFTRLQQYGDLDALIELYGHVRAENPTLEVFHRLASEVESQDLSSHVIMLGGIGWNKVSHRIQIALRQVPITQQPVADLKDGDIFCVEGSEGSNSFYPEFEDLGEGKELIADIAYLARLRNPFKVSHTLTICNGIFCNGVLGAVRCLTDNRVRDWNEKYLADRFPSGEFAMLVRVPVVANETVSPDLQNPDARLYEWAPNHNGRA